MRPHWITALTAAAMLSIGCQETTVTVNTGGAPPAPAAAQEAAPTTPETNPAPAKAPVAKAKATTATAKAPAPKAKATTAPAKAPAAKALPKRPAPKRATAARPASKLVAWDAPIAWMAWDAGVAKAKARKMPILLMVYADW